MREHANRMVLWVALIAATTWAWGCGAYSPPPDSARVSLVPRTPGAASVNPTCVGPGWSEECPPDSVMRADGQYCIRYRDLSPLLDPSSGLYRAELDEDNWIVPDGSGEVLELLAFRVIENGEGDGPPHGPYGNLYWDVFRADEPNLQSRDGAFRRRLARPRKLRGPHRTHAVTDEWLSGETLKYRNAGLFEWGSFDGTEEKIVLRIWESDLRSDDGRLGRRNDVLGMELIDRESTETPCGRWVPFYRYTNNHPRRRTNNVAAWALVRTRHTPELHVVPEDLAKGN